MSDQEYWENLGSIWADSENIWQQEELGYLPMFIESDRPGREFMMDDRERAFLDKLPEQFVVYRGYDERNFFGYSWSLCHWRARWFSKRFARNGEGKVAEAMCNKKDVIAVLLGRNELEIVIDPNNLVALQETMNIPHRPGWMNKVYKIAKKEFKLGESSAHNWWHWLKVERNALALASANEADAVVCQLFAIIHDCRRENEDDDPEHGTRSGALARELWEKKQLPISEEQLKKLEYACQLHNSGATHDDPTIGSCWDADRLDLIRVGVKVDPKYLSTKAAINLAWKT